MQGIEVTHLLDSSDNEFDDFFAEDVRVWYTGDSSMSNDVDATSIEIARETVADHLLTVSKEVLSQRDVFKVVRDAEQRNRMDIQVSGESSKIAVAETKIKLKGAYSITILSGGKKHRIALPTVINPEVKPVFHDVSTETDNALKRIKNLYTFLTVKPFDEGAFLKKLSTNVDRVIHAQLGKDPKYKLQAAFLKLYMTKSYEEQVMRTISKKLSAAEVVVDEDTGGMWISSTSLVDHGASCCKPVTTRYHLDSRSVDLLKKVVFSKRAAEVARAKIDLMSKVKPEHQNVLISSPASLLMYSYAEARLTHEEVLAMTFTVNSVTLEPRCPSCDNSVTVDLTIYHPKCQTIDWLIKYFQFEYDDDKRCISPKRGVYFSQNHRKMFEDIERYLSQLDTTFITRLNDTTTLWESRAGGLPRLAATARDSMLPLRSSISSGRINTSQSHFSNLL